MPELEKMLQLIRSQEQCPDKYFPAKLNRVMLGKAEKESSELSQHLCTVAYRALYGTIRWAEKTPVFGDAAELSERVALDFPRLYSMVLPGLSPSIASEQDVFRLLVREVFMPTFYLQLVKARQSSQGNELSTNHCWYLPQELHGTREYPFQRVVNAWINAAGCRGAEDIGKLMQSEAKRKIVSNWLKGKNGASRKEIARLVDSFKNYTDRFGDVQDWKGRLVFAAAMQRLFKNVDVYFLKTEPGFSFKLLGMLEQIEKDCVPIDCGNVLLGQHTFFTARLIYRRIKETERWKEEFDALPKQKLFSRKGSMTREELDEIQRKVRFQMNPGNLLLKFIRREISAAKKRRTLTAAAGESLHEQIFALGVLELNQILNKRGRQN